MDIRDTDADPCKVENATCSWPSVVGAHYRTAVAELQNTTGKHCIPIPTGSVVVTNYDPRRVYVWYNPDTSKVVRGT